MKYYLLILIVLFGVFDSIGQESEKIKRTIEILKHRDFKKVKSDLDELVNEFPSEIEKGKFKFYRNDISYFNHGFDLSSYQLKFSRTLSFNNGIWTREIYSLELVFTTQDSTVVFIRLEKSIPNSDKPKVLLNYCNELTLEYKFSLHDSIYLTKTPLNCNNLPFLNTNFYSPLCPRHGSDKFDQMIEYVNQEDFDQLKSLLKQFNMADKVYGYVGLYFLQKKGSELLDVQNSLMDYTKNLVATVQTDLGVKPVMLLIYDTALDRKFDDLIQNGKIKNN